MNKTSNVQINVMQGDQHGASGVSYEWDSYEAFMPDLAEIGDRRPATLRTIKEYASSGGSRWCGCDGGFDEVQQRIANGWPELREQVEKMLSGLDLELPVFPTLTTSRRRKRHRDDHGDTLDMTRVWNGQLETAWERAVKTERVTPNTKRVTLAFDVTANAYVTNDDALWRAALCILLTDSLARAGRTLEIWVVDSTARPFEQSGLGGVPARLWSAWCVKKTSDPLNMDRLCAMVGVGFMRTAGFAAMAAGPWKHRHTFGGALGNGLPYTLRERRKNGEVVVRIGQCYSRKEVTQEYENAWREVEAAAQLGVAA